jgi:hypothetical protein
VLLIIVRRSVRSVLRGLSPAFRNGLLAGQ